MALTTYPHRLECDNADRPISNCALRIPRPCCCTLPPTVCGMQVRGEPGQCAPRSARRSVAADGRHPPQRGLHDRRAHPARFGDASTQPGNQSVQLILDASEGNRSFLLNITPRLGFNRYIPKDRRGACRRRGDDGTIGSRRRRRWPRSTRHSTTTPGGSCGRIDLDALLHDARGDDAIARCTTWACGSGMPTSMRWRTDTSNRSWRRIRSASCSIIRREDGMIPDAIHDEGTVTHLEHARGCRRDQAAAAGVVGLEVV